MGNWLNFLIHSSFQGVNRIFVLLFENEAQKNYKQSATETAIKSLKFEDQKSIIFSIFSKSIWKKMRNFFQFSNFWNLAKLSNSNVRITVDPSTEILTSCANISHIINEFQKLLNRCENFKFWKLIRAPIPNLKILTLKIKKFHFF